MKGAIGVSNIFKVQFENVQLEFSHCINFLWLNIDIDVLAFLSCHEQIFESLLDGEVVASTCYRINKRAQELKNV